MGAHVHAAAVGPRDRAGRPAGFDDVIQRAMAKDPADRYASAGELGRAARGRAGSRRRRRRERGSARLRRRSADRPPATAPRRRLGGRARPAGRGRPRRAAAPDRRRRWRSCLLRIGRFEHRAAPRPRRHASALRAASTWRRLPPMPTARQNMASAVLDGTIWVVGGLGAGSKGSRKVEGYDPVINAWKAGPDLPVRLHHEMAVDLQGRAGRDRRLDPEGIRSERRGLRPRVRPARRKLGRAALPATGPARPAPRPWSAIGSWSSAARPMAAWSPTTEVFDGKRWTTGGGHPDAARAPRGGLGRALRLRGRRTGPVARQELRRARALRPRRRPLGAAARHADRARRPRRGDRRRADLSRSAARPRPTRWARSSPTTSRAKSWSSAPAMRTPRHGIAVAAIGRTALRARRRHAARPRDRGGDGGGAAARVGTASACRHSTWRRLPPMPTARQNMPSAVLDGTIWVAGGLEPAPRARASRGL